MVRVRVRLKVIAVFLVRVTVRVTVRVMMVTAEEWARGLSVREKAEEWAGQRGQRCRVGRGI